MPSNGGTGNVVHHDLDLHFQDHEFLIVNISINGSRKRLKIVAKFQLQRIFNPVYGNKTNLSFFQILFSFFSPFSGGVENTYSQFLTNCLTNSRYFADYDQGSL